MALSKPATAPVLDITALSSAKQSLWVLQNYFKTELLSKIRTGDVIYDAFIAFTILSAQDTLTSYIGQIKDWLMRFPVAVLRLIQWLVRWWRGSIKVPKQATVKYITDGREVNTLFEPVLWYINSLTDTKAEPQISLHATKHEQTVTQQIPKTRTAKIQFMDHEIQYTISTEIITIHADREHKRENVIIDLYTMVEKNRAVDIFQQFSETCLKKYAEFNKKKKWEQCVFRNDGDTWKSQKSKTFRKMNTVILKNGQTEDITADINDFIQKEEWYVSRDIPYTRRYMFWGTPGTGKSSCIKALAGHTKRHIHYLVLSEVKSDSMLLKLLEKIDFSETILVIEDIDCASKITHERIRPYTVDKDTVEDDSNKPETTLTLSGLLNAIDGGIIENHGQIMVMTTNHPEHLDAALTRPGRVDRKFEFSYCDDDQVARLFFNFFERYPATKHAFPKNTISPAQVTSVLLQYKKDPDYAWQQVIAQLG